MTYDEFIGNPTVKDKNKPEIQLAKVTQKLAATGALLSFSFQQGCQGAGKLSWSKK